MSTVRPETSGWPPAVFLTGSREHNGQHRRSGSGIYDLTAEGRVCS